MGASSKTLGLSESTLLFIIRVLSGCFSGVPKKPFPLTLSKKYIVMEKIKNKLKSLKNMLNEIKKKLELHREQEINETKIKQKGSLMC